VGLCPWHHRGHTQDQTKQYLSGLVGPSYAHGRRGFQAFFGTDDLLLKIQNVILQHYDESPWFDYQPDRNIIRKAQHIWSER
jgi:hypothetical protein